MDAPSIKKSESVTEFPPAPGNPRNSEGDFLRLTDGRILFAYSGYVGDSGHDDAPCNVAGAVSADDGRTWTRLPGFLAAAAEHGVKNIMSVSLVRLTTGEACLVYLVKHPPESYVVLRRFTDETALTLGEAEVIVPEKRGIYYVVNNSRVCALSDGSLLLPMARHKIVKRADGERGGVYFGTCAMFKGDPDGRNWRQESRVLFMQNPGASGTGLQEPGAVERPDATVYGYFRTDRGYQFDAVSPDGGKTWSAPASSRFSSPDSPMLIRRDPFSGLYYAVWNPIPCYNGRLSRERRWVHAGRNPLVLAVSENCADFSPYTVLEGAEDHGFCYPAMFFPAPGVMLLSYCCGGEEDGTCLSKTRIRRIELDDTAGRTAE